MKNVLLKPLGEPPTFSQGASPHFLDEQILQAEGAPYEEQRRVFLVCATRLYDFRIYGDPADELDFSDDDEWMRRLGYWFAWPDEVREQVQSEAMRQAMEVRSHEIEDAQED